MICPQCQSGHTVHIGKNRSGTRRYLCKNCEHRFSEQGVRAVGRPLKAAGECPQCGSVNTKKNGRYCLCKECGKNFKQQSKPQ